MFDDDDDFRVLKRPPSRPPAPAADEGGATRASRRGDHGNDAARGGAHAHDLHRFFGHAMEYRPAPGLPWRKTFLRAASLAAQWGLKRHRALVTADAIIEN